MNLHNHQAMQTIVDTRESDDPRRKCVVQNPYVAPALVETTMGAVRFALLRGNREEADAALDRHYRQAEEERVTKDSPIAVLLLAQRVLNGLEDRGIHRVGQLARYSPMRLIEIPNFGRRTVRMIQEELHKHGFTLTDDTPAPEDHSHTVDGAKCDPGFRKHREAG
jgi:hypothetical protein